jgi:hypothetical protein
MAILSKLKVTGPKTWVGWVVLVLIGLGALQYVNWFVYPFTSATPNFADVEKVYSRMVVPSTWTKLGEGANKGLHGRQCPVESDGCFSKAATFSVPNTVTVDEIKEAYKSMGCVSVLAERTDQVGGVSYTSFRCSTGAMHVSGSLTERETWSLTINVSSR